MEHDVWLDLAERFTLTGLEGEELSRFEAHLSAGCPLCDARIRETGEALVQLPQSLPPLPTPGGAKTRLFDRIGRGEADYTFVYASEEEWHEIAPGIFAKVLFSDTIRQRITALVRMEPGSRYADHRHTSAEELFVLQGSCYCGGRLLRAGDYHRAEAGSLHFDTRTDEGSLMLVIGSMHNQMLV